MGEPKITRVPSELEKGEKESGSWRCRGQPVTETEGFGEEWLRRAGATDLVLVRTGSLCLSNNQLGISVADKNKGSFLVRITCPLRLAEGLLHVILTRGPRGWNTHALKHCQSSRRTGK